MSINVINCRCARLLLLTWLWLNFALIVGSVMLKAPRNKFPHYKIDNLLTEEDKEPLSWRKSRRWRRQALSSEHVLVHSMDSNVSISKQLMVLSSQSKIELREVHLNTTVWSNTSLLAFDGASQESVALRTTNTTFADLRLNTAHLQAVANGLELNMTTEREKSEQTRLNLALFGNFDLIVSDHSFANSVLLEASRGTVLGGFAQSWANSNVTSTKLSIASVLDETQNIRQLSVAVVSSTYQMQVRLEGAELSMLYEKFRLNIAANYQTMVLHSDHRLIQLHSVSSPFEVMVTDTELTIDCFDEKTNVKVLGNSSIVNVNVGQFSRTSTNLSESGSVLHLQNTSISEDLAVESIELLSLASQLFIDGASATNGSSSSVLVQALQSQLSLNTNASLVKLTSARQAIEILGGQPSIILQTGNITMIISYSVNQTTPAPLFQPNQLAPSEDVDKAFAEIGPYATELPASQSNNYQTFSPNQQISVDQLPSVLGGASSSALLPTPTPVPIHFTNFFHITTSNSFITSGIDQITASHSASTDFPVPNPSLFHSHVEDDETEHVEAGAGTTKADNFVIGQYENNNEEWTISAEKLSTTDSTLFPIFATISSIDLDSQRNDTEQEDDIFGNSTAQKSLRKLRRLRHLVDGPSPQQQQQPFNTEMLLEFKVKMPQESNLSSEDLKIELERILNEIAQSSFYKVNQEISQNRQQPMLANIQVVDVQRVFVSPNSTASSVLILQLMVQTKFLEDLPAIVEQFNQLDQLVLGEKFEKKLMSDIRVKRRSPAIYSILQSFAIIPAGILIISVSFAAVFWVVGAKTFFLDLFFKCMDSCRNRRRVQSIRPEVDSRSLQSA